MRPDVGHKAVYESMGGAKVSYYKIRVNGHLEGSWSAWFDGLEITNLENGETMLYGDIVDRAALHGAHGPDRVAGRRARW
jgi:hypothetical protein